MLADPTQIWGQSYSANAHASLGPDSGLGRVHSIPLPALLTEAAHQSHEEDQRGQASCPGSHIQLAAELTKAGSSRALPHSPPGSARLLAESARPSPGLCCNTRGSERCLQLPSALSHLPTPPAACPWPPQDGPAWSTAHPLAVGAESSLRAGPSPSQGTPPALCPSSGSPTAAQDEVLLLGGPLGARARQSEAQRGLLGAEGNGVKCTQSTRCAFQRPHPGGLASPKPPGHVPQLRALPHSLGFRSHLSHTCSFRISWEPTLNPTQGYGKGGEMLSQFGLGAGCGEQGQETSVVTATHNSGRTRHCWTFLC